MSYRVIRSRPTPICLASVTKCPPSPPPPPPLPFPSPSPPSLPSSSPPRLLPSEHTGTSRVLSMNTESGSVMWPASWCRCSSRTTESSCGAGGREGQEGAGVGAGLGHGVCVWGGGCGGCTQWASVRWSFYHSHPPTRIRKAGLKSSKVRPVTLRQRGGSSRGGEAAAGEGRQQRGRGGSSGGGEAATEAAGGYVHVGTLHVGMCMCGHAVAPNNRSLWPTTHACVRAAHWHNTCRRCASQSSTRQTTPPLHP